MSAKGEGVMGVEGVKEGELLLMFGCKIHFEYVMITT